MRLAGTIFFTVAVCAWSTVMYAWVDQRQRVARQRSITAQAALRRRIDRELDAIRAGIVEELDRLWGHVHEDETDDEPELDDLAWQDNPVTQPITLPAPAGPAQDDGSRPGYVRAGQYWVPVDPLRFPAGPATEPADQVLIAHWAEDVPHPVDSEDRKAQHEAWVTSTLARYEYTGRNR